MFRKLKATEIEVRVQSIKEGKGAVLLLYKDARCDMNILDETVGAFNWQREHKLIGEVMYCGISIYDKDKNEWITKWDAGSESTMEKEKGASSDSYKRSAFNWGIGRELYTSPFIWITWDKFNKYDKYTVEKIAYDEQGISGLSIKNGEGKRVFVWQSKHGKDNEQKESTDPIS